MSFNQSAAESLLSELVAARTTNPPGDERAAVPVIEAAAARFGLGEASRLGAVRSANLIYRIGEGAPTLLIAAHMDTMPPETSTPGTPTRSWRRSTAIASAGSASPT
ncbi:MAG: hypothetical protein U0R24_10750 [Solirubrobacterales bacterium]